MIKTFFRSDIDNMETRYRAHFVNSLSGFKSANLVGSIDQQGIENLAVVSSVVHLGANPPLMGMVMRPHTVRRDTLENIKATKVYTLNHIGVDFVEQAHQSSASYQAEENEFDKVGLDSEYLSDFIAPFVQQSAIKLGMALVEIVPIKHNGTVLIIGEIVQAHVAANAIQSDGFVSLSSKGIVAINGLDAYVTQQQEKRFPYAKP
ncbi:flavin reductase [Alteromonas sp. 5E99-2]|uniref:flavin reductase family protein n=1 Tax=Alteromonas sp. 5E99-2 TaxID=2817683 RepID=UPI001A97E9C5|nr:flavin reductase [Alteromonas sp. 5E99-2]MBO1256716.1 flavin reductase [Alteromonas sp. 5E99-2]